MAPEPEDTETLIRAAGGALSYVHQLGASNTIALSPDGSFQGAAHQSGQYPDAWRDGLIAFCNDVNRSLREAAQRLSANNETEYEPMYGWAYLGGKWAACSTAGGRVTTFSLRDRTDTSKMLDAMLVKGWVTESTIV